MARRPSASPKTPAIPAAPRAPLRLGWLAAFALVGLAAALSSTWVHYQLIVDPNYSGFCDINSTFNCAQAYTSRYGSIAGVPVAVLGALFFAFVLALVGLGARAPQVRPRIPGYVFALSTVGLAAILYFAYASFFVLQAVCLLCVTTYVAVIGLFVVSGLGARESMGALAGKAGADAGVLLSGPAGLGAGVAFVALALAAFLWFPDASSSMAPSAAGVGAPPATTSAALTPEQIAELERFLEAQPRLPVTVPNAAGPVVIMKFNDYQCPACAQTWHEYRGVLARYASEQPGTVDYRSMDYPLEGECNTFAPGGTHTGACEAAVAVRLAREQGRADEMEAWLYANQPRLNPETVRAAAREVGGVTDFDDRYEATLALVRADVALGGQLDVRGTPTFFMNGLRLPGLRADYFDAAIQWELRRAGQE